MLPVSCLKKNILRHVTGQHKMIAKQIYSLGSQIPKFTQNYCLLFEMC